MKRLELLMAAEGEDNWIRGVRSVIRALDAGEMKEAARTYKRINSGANSFSDFYIWREDFNQRYEANRELGQLRAEIWRTLVDGE